MPSLVQSQTPEEYLFSGVISVVPASLTDDCTICTEPYTAPVVLVCGHIFCRECLKDHLGHGGTTCPICRAVLFCPPPAADARAQRDGEDMTDAFDSFVLARRPAYAGALARARPVRETLHRGAVIARGGLLNQCGACLIVRGLWYRTAVSLHAHSTFNGRAIGPEEAEDMDVEMLRSCIQQVIPDGIQLGERCWTVLYDAAKMMLVWHCMVRTAEERWRIERGEEWPPAERLENMVEELLAASHEEGMR